MIYNSISDYNITKDAFLSSKNEMMDRDLLNTTEDINRVYTEWCLRYIRENRDEIFRPMTEEEQKVQDTGRRVVFDALLANENIDFDDADPTEQKYIARYLFYLYLQTLFNSAQKYNYSSIYLLDVTEPGTCRARPLSTTLNLSLHRRCLHLKPHDHSLSLCACQKTLGLSPLP